MLLAIGRVNICTQAVRGWFLLVLVPLVFVAKPGHWTDQLRNGLSQTLPLT
jgi:hypothetical protein